MKTITDITEANILLQRYNGATAQICMFGISLKRLALRLTLANVSEVIYIVGVSCEHIAGSFAWNNANLSISSEIDKGTNETITRIADKKAGFELITTGGFSVAMGLLNEFGTSFDNFIKKEN
jgi:hypothetical protein